MKGIKLAVVGLMSMFVLSLGLGMDTTKEDSSTKFKPVMKMYSEHGEGI